MVPAVMGIVNVTPDSFSDGGRFLDPDAAVAHGRRLVAEGAAVVDVGGESTRPGADPVDPAEEIRRAVPVIEALVAEGVRCSIDTRHPSVAEAAIEAGATLLNDVSASLWEIAAAAKVGWVALHMQGEPRTMQVEPRYDDVVGEVRDFLLDRAEQAVAAGVPEVWIDPGIGFGKTLEHNVTLLHRLGELTASGHPVLVGTSRKGFLGALTGGAPVDDRLEASLATAVVAAASGARMVRAHDVLHTVHAMRIVGEGVSAT